MLPNGFKFRNAFATSASSNYPNSNEVCLKFCVFIAFLSILIRVPAIPQQTFVLILLKKKKKKKILANFLLSTFRKFSEFEYKTHYAGHSFALYYLVFAWVKFHVNIMRFTRLGAHQSLKCFSKNFQTFLLALQNFGLISTRVIEHNRFNRFHSYKRTRLHKVINTASDLGCYFSAVHSSRLKPLALFTFIWSPAQITFLWPLCIPITFSTPRIIRITISWPCW